MSVGAIPLCPECKKPEGHFVPARLGEPAYFACARSSGEAAAVICAKCDQPESHIHHDGSRWPGRLSTNHPYHPFVARGTNVTQSKEWGAYEINGVRYALHLPCNTAYLYEYCPTCAGLNVIPCEPVSVLVATTQAAASPSPVSAAVTPTTNSEDSPMCNDESTPGHECRTNNCEHGPASPVGTADALPETFKAHLRGCADCSAGEMCPDGQSLYKARIGVPSHWLPLDEMIGRVAKMEGTIATLTASLASMQRERDEAKFAAERNLYRAEWGEQSAHSRAMQIDGLRANIAAAESRLTAAEQQMEAMREKINRAWHFAWKFGRHEAPCPLAADIDAPDGTPCTCGYNEAGDGLMDDAEALDMDWTGQGRDPAVWRPATLATPTSPEGP